jgi:hypothetical protein
MPRAGEENHLLDCEVYNNALADYLGVARMTPEQWHQLAMMRGVPDGVLSPDLFAPAPLKAAAAASEPKRTETANEIVEIAEKSGWSNDDVASFWD